MTPIQFALAEIRDRIPNQLLTIAFRPKSRFNQSFNYNPTTIESQILDKVINGRIRRYIDGYGAQEVHVSLVGLPVRYDIHQAWTMHIPKDRLSGRSITSVISVAYSPILDEQVTPYGSTIGSLYGRNVYNSCQQPAETTMLAQAIVDNNRPLELTYTPNVYLIDENTIYCEDKLPQGSLSLKCLVAADNEFSFIQGPHYPIFADLCVLATQAYIYNQDDIILDRASTEGGVELKIRELIDRFSDADERFMELMNGRGRKILRMADKPRRNHYLNLLVSRHF